jgi:hypothetical protein
MFHMYVTFGVEELALMVWLGDPQERVTPVAVAVGKLVLPVTVAVAVAVQPLGPVTVTV